ncbi:MAG: class I SAM-dependent methyltransferase [Saprospiraceae bacterium]|jgi:adenine-specific DNA-methyltransferase|nr:class I SAM-dependent methyltransferase [Saprospiraceae bacterium]
MKLITETSSEKLRGGYYTPEPIADFILRWGINGDKNLDILEPSCGDGVFLRQMLQLGLPYNSVTGIELDPEEAEKSDSIELGNKQIINDDFHTYCNNTHRRFDLIIGNPPYIRYQFFDTQQQVSAEDIFIKAGLKYSKLANAWVSFVVGSALLLKDHGGKMGFVLPAEILQVSYAKQLRAFLARSFNKINIISFKKLVFSDIQQEVVLLLCERDGTQKHAIDHVELMDAKDLENLDLNKLKCPRKRLDFNSNKWTFYFLEQHEIDFLENIAQQYNIPNIGKYANIEVGITTGSNNFFSVPLSVVEQYKLERYAKPLVGRSVQVSSAIFNHADWLQNKNSSAKAHLLVFPEKTLLEGEKGALTYIALGESVGIHHGYKCGIRNDWFMVPSLKISDALFIRRNNLFPRLIVNEARAFTTDTMHRVFAKPGTDVNALTASYYNSLSLAMTEVCGRSHGGGVLELMPSEAERVLLPYHFDNSHLINEIDRRFRENQSIEDILLFTNKVLLKEQYGLSLEEIRLAHSIWRKLSSRRLNRGRV